MLTNTCQEQTLVPRRSHVAGQFGTETLLKQLLCGFELACCIALAHARKMVAWQAKAVWLPLCAQDGPFFQCLSGSRNDGINSLKAMEGMRSTIPGSTKLSASCPDSSLAVDRSLCLADTDPAQRGDTTVTRPFLYSDETSG